MMWIVGSSFFWFFLVIQAVGLAGVTAARLGEKTCAPARCQLTFFGCLLLVGAATLVCLQLGNGYWLPSGVMLSVMVVGATLDCSGVRCAREF
jgi:hypothetical protein